MQNGIQSIYLSLGEEACFFLQILNIAEKKTGFSIDPITAALVCKNKGYIHFNTKDFKDKANFLVIEHSKILELFTGDKWEYVKESSNYRCKPNEFAINEYATSNFIHFDSDNFHSLQNSNTVKNGKIISKRIFRLK